MDVLVRLRQRVDVTLIDVLGLFVTELAFNPALRWWEPLVGAAGGYLLFFLIAKIGSSKEEQLRRFDCDTVQGYLLGRPVPAANFIESNALEVLARTAARETKSSLKRLAQTAS